MTIEDQAPQSDTPDLRSQAEMQSGLSGPGGAAQAVAQGAQDLSQHGELEAHAYNANLKAAMAGDQNAKDYIASHSLGTAVGSLKSRNLKLDVVNKAADEGEIAIYSGNKKIPNAVTAEGSFPGPDYDWWFQKGQGEVDLPYQNPFIFEHLAIDPSVQGEGIGSSVVRRMIKEARKSGADAIFGNASPMGAGSASRDPKRLDDLIRFYEKHGFTVHQKGPDNAIIIKDLRPPKKGYAHGGVVQPEHEVTNTADSLFMADGGDVPSQVAYVPMIDPAGERQEVHPDDVQKAAQTYGFRTPTTEENAAHESQKLYGSGAGNLLGAFAAGAGRGASFGASDLALTKSGAVSPETLAGLQREHPLASTAGELAGITASAFGAPEALLAKAGVEVANLPRAVQSLINPVKAVAGIGEGAGKLAENAIGRVVSKEAAPLANKIVTRLGSATFGSAIEGALYSGGKDVSEYALGDPDLNGEKAMANIGYGALLGGGLGAAFGVGSLSLEGAKNFYGFGKSKLFGGKSAAQKAYEDTIATNGAKAATTTLDIPMAPSTPEEIVERLKASPYQGLSPELTSKQSLQESVERLGPKMEVPPLAPEYQALTDQRANDWWRTFVENPNDEMGRQVQNYRAMMKKEGVQKSLATIRSIAPGKELTADVMKAGDDLIGNFTKQYQAEKEELAPFFKRFDEAAIAPAGKPDAVAESIERAIPGASNYLTKDVEGNLTLAKYKSSMPFTRKVHSAIDDILEASNEKGATLGGLRNVRENIRGDVNFLTAPKDSAQISSLRKNLMDYIEGGIQKIDPSLEVRDTFKRYATNEESRAEVERLFGGSISDKASFAKQIKPEDVLNKLFANSVAVKASKALLGEDFNHALGNYMYGRFMNEATDLARNGFSSNKFNTFLKNKAPELGVAFSEKPGVLQDIQDWTNVMRILPDQPSVNPSGTAKTFKILETMKKIGSILHPNPAHIAGEALQKATATTGGFREEMMYRAMLKGENAEAAGQLADEKVYKYTLLGKAERVLNKVNQAIESQTADVFKGRETAAQPYLGYAASKLTSIERKERHQEMVAMVNHLSQDPSALINKLEQSTKDVFPVAPKTSGAIHAAAVRATQFLASKTPKPIQQLPLSRPYEPTPQEILKFDRYVQAVENPITAMSGIQNDTTTHESIETLQTVYPKLYDQMKMGLLEELTGHLSKNEFIPHKTKMGLSLFLGQDLMHSISQPFLSAVQQTWSTPGAAQAQNDLDQRVKTSQKGLSAINIASRVKTPMQASADRSERA